MRGTNTSSGSVGALAQGEGASRNLSQLIESETVQTRASIYATLAFVPGGRGFARRGLMGGDSMHTMLFLLSTGIVAFGAVEVLEGWRRYRARRNRRAVIR